MTSMRVAVAQATAGRNYKWQQALNPPSPAFAAAVVLFGMPHHGLDVELREWEARSGKLWRKWHRLSEPERIKLVRGVRELVKL